MLVYIVGYLILAVPITIVLYGLILGPRKDDEGRYHDDW